MRRIVILRNEWDYSIWRKKESWKSGCYFLYVPKEA